MTSRTASRQIGSLPTLGWVMITGTVMLAIPLRFGNTPNHVSAQAWGWMLLSGGGNVVGLAFAYQAYRIGVLSLVAPVIATEGAVAAAIGIATGDAVSARMAIGLVLVVIGTLLTGAAGQTRSNRASTAGLRWAICAALSFGGGLFATARAGALLPLAWAIAPPRFLGLLFIVLPLLVLGRLPRTRPAIYLASITGCLEVIGFASYTVGARQSVTIAAPLAGAVGLVAALLGFAFLRETLARHQVVGVAVLTIGVLALAGSHT